MTLKVRMAGSKAGEVFLYDDIGGGFFGGIGAKDVVAQVNALGKIDTLNVRINSAGGDVFEGLTIYNFLNKHPARVTVDIDGLAASIASIIAMCGEEIHMAENAMMMIHDPFTMMAGTAEDFRKQADMMDQVKGNMVGIYQARTKTEHAKIAAMMSEETWLKASEAVQFGFADAVTENLQIAAKFDPTRFKNTPRDYGIKVEQKPSNVFRAKLADMAKRAKTYG
jgi:ATP-dependent Clp protease protease subunit